MVTGANHEPSSAIGPTAGDQPDTISDIVLILPRIAILNGNTVHLKLQTESGKLVISFKDNIGSVANRLHSRGQ
jgi:hypothetical protein